MPQHALTRRFRSRARTITVACLAAAFVVVGGGALSIPFLGVPRDGILAAHAVASLAIAAIVGAFGMTTARRERALRVLAERHPDAVVFLARRLPPVVSDLPAFLSSKGLDVRIGDGWYGAVADDRGVSVYAITRNPRELLVMEWGELGELAMVRTPTVGGDSRWSVVADVRPFVVPLTVDFGGASGIVTMPLDAIDTSAVLRAIEAWRP